MPELQRSNSERNDCSSQILVTSKCKYCTYFFQSFLLLPAFLVCSPAQHVEERAGMAIPSGELAVHSNQVSQHHRLEQLAWRTLSFACMYAWTMHGVLQKSAQALHISAGCVMKDSASYDASSQLSPTVVV
eukprot:1137029-Pelagomonas_calceolata.AAC.3